MKIQQYWHQADVMSTCGRQHRVNVRKNSLIDADRETVPVESHTRPRIAEQEHTHD